MSQEVIENLNNLAQKLGIVIDWTNPNVLFYLQDLMRRYISLQNSYAIVWCLISITMIIGSIVVIRLCLKAIKTNSIDVEDSALGVVLSTAILIIFVVVLFVNIFNLLQNIFMPEITILEYLKTINLEG